MKFNTIYSHDRAISALFATVNNEESMTQQSDAKDTDINVIMQRYKVTGQIPLPRIAPNYGDFSEVTDYREALERVQYANEVFNSLPAKLRAQFSNNPAEFVDFATNPENIDEMRKMGLAPPKREDIITTPATPPAPPKGNDDGKGSQRPDDTGSGKQ